MFGSENASIFKGRVSVSLKNWIAINYKLSRFS
jgi:hypothetical protein